MVDSKAFLDLKIQVDSNAKMLSKIVGFMENLSKKDNDKVLSSLLEDQRLKVLEDGMEELQKNAASHTNAYSQQGSVGDVAFPDVEWSTLTSSSLASTEQVDFAHVQQNLKENCDDETSVNFVQHSQQNSKLDLIGEHVSLEKSGVGSVVMEEKTTLDEKVHQLGTTLTEVEDRVFRKLESMESKMDDISSHLTGVNSKLDTVGEQKNTLEATKSAIEGKVSETKVIAAFSTMKLKQDLDLIKAQLEKEKLVIETNHKEVTSKLNTVFDFVKDTRNEFQAGGLEEKMVEDHKAKHEAEAQQEQASCPASNVSQIKNLRFFFKLKEMNKNRRSTEDQCSDIWDIGQHNLMCKVRIYSDLMGFNEDMYIGLYSRKGSTVEKDATVPLTKLSVQVKVLPQGRGNKEEWALNNWKEVEIKPKSQDWENTMVVKRTSRKNLRGRGLVVDGEVLLQVDFNLL